MGGRLLGPWEMRQGMGMGCPDRVGDGLGEQWGVGGRLLGCSGMRKLSIAKIVDLSLTVYWAKEMHLFGAKKKCATLVRRRGYLRSAGSCLEIKCMNLKPETPKSMQVWACQVGITVWHQMRVLESIGRVKITMFEVSQSIPKPSFGATQ